MGFGLSWISYDAYQSQHSVNTVVKEGFKATLRSVDRMNDLGREELSPTDNKKSRTQPEYFSFRSILAEDRIWLPNCIP